MLPDAGQQGAVGCRRGAASILSLDGELTRELPEVGTVSAVISWRLWGLGAGPERNYGRVQQRLHLLLAGALGRQESLAGAFARRDRGLALVLVARQLRLDRGDLGRVAVGPRARRLETILGLTLAAAREGHGGGSVGELEPVLLEAQPLQLGVPHDARERPAVGLTPSDRRLGLSRSVRVRSARASQGAAAQPPQRARGFVQLLAPAACLLARREGLSRQATSPRAMPAAANGPTARAALRPRPRTRPCPGGAAKQTQVAPQPATGVPERPGVEDLRARCEARLMR